MFDRITTNPAILSGQPTIRGMRLTVRRVIEALAITPNWDDLRREHPELEPEDIRQALAFAARNLDDSIQSIWPGIEAALTIGAMVTVTDRAVRIRHLPVVNHP